MSLEWTSSRGTTERVSPALIPRSGRFFAGAIRPPGNRCLRSASRKAPRARWRRDPLTSIVAPGVRNLRTPDWSVSHRTWPRGAPPAARRPSALEPLRLTEVVDVLSLGSRPDLHAAVAARSAVPLSLTVIENHSYRRAAADRGFGSEAAGRPPGTPVAHTCDGCVREVSRGETRPRERTLN